MNPRFALATACNDNGALEHDHGRHQGTPMSALPANDGRPGYALFDSPIGLCGIAWSERGIVRIQLPEATRTATSARLTAGRALREARPPAAVARAITRITRHLGGVPQDLSD